ncbi:MAG: MFS transporter [Thaumarchaeota archaeon]|nr:MFS transporter [Nitrososphaerota archaeon]
MLEQQKTTSPKTLVGELSVLYISVFLTRIVFGAIVILFPSYVDAGPFVSGVVIALYPILEAGSALPVGRYLDRAGRRKPFLMGLFLMAALTVAIGLTFDITLIAIAHTLMGLAAATTTIGSLTMITDLTRKSNRGGGMGLFDFANIAGYAAGALLAGRFEVQFQDDPGYSFLAIGVLMLVAAIVSLIFLKEPEHPKSEERSPLNPLRNFDSETKALLPMWLGITTIVGLAFFLPKIFPRGELLGSSNLGLLAAAGLVTLGVAATGFGRLSDKIGREKVIVIGVIGQLGLLISLALTYPNWFGNMALLGIFIFLTSALVPSVLAAVGDRIRGEMRGSALGLYSMMLGVGLAVGNIAGGYVGEVAGVRELFLVGFGIFAVSVMVSALIAYRAKRVSP